MRFIFMLNNFVC